MWTPNKYSVFTSAGYEDADSTYNASYNTTWDTIGHKQYELNNHLGNVMATITDRRLQQFNPGDTTVAYYKPDISTAQEYYAFGSLQPGKTFTAGTNYRYGFNGKENDNEVKGDGNQQDYGMRMYDPRLGRFLSVDPLAKKYPELTPYQFASNTPIQATDLDGAEKMDFKTHMAIANASGQSVIGLFSYAEDWLTSGLFGMADGYKDYMRNEFQDKVNAGYNQNVPDYIKKINYNYNKTKANVKIASGMLDWYGKNQDIMTTIMGSMSGPIVDEFGVISKNFAKQLPGNESFLREAYETEVRGMRGDVKDMLKRNKSIEEIARTVSEKRRELGVKYKDLTPPGLRDVIYNRNIEKYGDKLGPTVEWLRKQGHTWEEIIEKSLKTGGQDIKELPKTPKR